MFSRLFARRGKRRTPARASVSEHLDRVYRNTHRDVQRLQAEHRDEPAKAA